MERDPSVPLNRDQASDTVSAIEDPVLKHLMTLALGAATVRLVRWNHQSEAEYRSQLPDAPFDLLFFVRVVEQLFADQERIQRVLRGEIDDTLGEGEW
jgi:hypothetical protein